VIEYEGHGEEFDEDVVAEYGMVFEEIVILSVTIYFERW
jgi:hypothetical protein